MSTKTICRIGLVAKGVERRREIRKASEMIYCKTCGFPITEYGCLHIVLGYTAEQWEKMTDAKRNQALRNAKEKLSPFIIPDQKAGNE